MNFLDNKGNVTRLWNYLIVIYEVKWYTFLSHSFVKEIEQ